MSKHEKTRLQNMELLNYITHNPRLKTLGPRVPKMAADSDDSSSSSDEEAFRRCQEAVWENKTDQHKGTTCLFIIAMEQTNILFFKDFFLASSDVLAWLD